MESPQNADVLSHRYRWKHRLHSSGVHRGRRPGTRATRARNAGRLDGVAASVPGLLPRHKRSSSNWRRRAGAYGLLTLFACGPTVGPGAAPQPGSSGTTRAAAPSSARQSVSGPVAPPVRGDGTVMAETVLMGTQVTVNVWLADPQAAGAAGAAIHEALAEVARIERIASEWRDESDLSRLNRAAGADPVPVPAELAEILLRARSVSQATHGRFDVTFHAVGRLWQFTHGNRPPLARDIAASIHLVDWRNVHVDPIRGTARLTQPGMQVGLGAIAKGYAVDRASQLLRHRGFGQHIVEAGGDTYVSGAKGNQPWLVGIKSPGQKRTLAALPLENRAIVTSGTYERYFEYEGREYTHILDPRTGWPLERASSPQSVSIVANTATDADAFATAITIMGSQEGMAFVEERTDLEAVIIDSAGRLAVSSGLQPVLRVTPTGR
ncbi:MAG: FAD:protein FMN transferase [Myxococcales bacterium FL481]|nr:MAG: FAD:protein FMN transferase [Myxococcales bacterium FL481]